MDDIFKKDTKFEPLKKYFEGFEIGDVADLGEELFINSALPIDKPKMMLFAIRYPELFEKFDIDRANFVQSSVEHSRKGTLELSKGIASSAYHGYDEGTMIDSYCKSLKNHEELDVSHIKLVSCDRAGLLDIDIKFVLQLAEILTQRGARDFEIDIRRNRFHGYEDPPKFFEYLTRLLNIENVKYVNIASNPVASNDSEKYFTEMDINAFRKLIWIPKLWINNENFYEICGKDSERKLIVKNVHKEYYSR